MASGDILISKYSTSDPNTNFIGQWSSVPNASNNSSTLRIQIYATKQTGDPIVARDVTTTVTIQPTGYDVGITKSETVQLTLIPGSQQQQTIFDQTWTVNHDAEGNSTVYISEGISGVVQGTGAQSITLDHIDRPTSVIISLASKTETGITINWNTLSPIDYLWYSTNGGSTYTANGSVSGTSGSITITGLSAFTTYSVKLKVRRASNQAISESDSLSVKTYSYPYATNMPAFSIGDVLRVGLYNPLGRSVSVKLQDANGNQLASQSTSTTQAQGFNGANAITALYGSIPNAKEGTYKIAVTYGGHTETRTGGKYYCVAAECTPEIGTITYEDINGTVQAIIGDNTVLVQGLSTPKVTASNLTSKKSASIASVTASIPGQTITLAIAGTTAIGTLNAVTSAVDVTCVITLTDSRGYTATKSVTMTVLEYAWPQVSATVRRHNNYYSETDITPSVVFSPLEVSGTPKNSITIQYSASAPGQTTITGFLTNNTTSTVTLDLNYDWTIVIIASDALTQVGSISVFVSEGVPIIFFDRDKYSVGINCFPKFEKTFEVDGAVLNKNIMTATATGVQASSSTMQISLTSDISVGDQLTLDSGSITIGAKISKVLVSLKVDSLGATAGTHSIWIYKNNTSVASANLTLQNSASVETLVIPPTLVSVQENDTLSVYIGGYASNNFISASLTVEAVQ